MRENNSTLDALQEEQHRLWGLFRAEETDKGRKARFAEIKAVGRQINEIRKAAEQAQEVQKQALRQDLWSHLRIDPVPFLAALRDAIVNAPEPVKRTPKWRFKIADDFALQIQAKDRERVLFEGVALEGEGINADSFAENRNEHQQLRQLKFDIRPDGEAWVLKPTFGYYGKVDVEKNEYGYQPRALVEEAGQRGLIALKARIVEALGSIFRDGEVPMLSDHCLMCGKGLTDPVSRSRLIGPECAGKSSIVAPLYLCPSDDSANGKEAPHA
jgi:hypothetical protein